MVTVGNFDGVHRGHRALLEEVVRRARSSGAPACVFTFEPAPIEVLHPERARGRLQTLGEKVRCLGEVGVDEVVVERFDLDYSRHDPQWFATEVLGRRLDARAVVLGWDFRFGRDREGSAADLGRWLPIPVERMDPLMDGEKPVSSSRIREALLAGDVAAATGWLGRPHAVVGTVVRGDRRGGKIGFPTANVSTPPGIVLPAPGVYATVLEAAGTARSSVANLGFRPTFAGGTAAPVLEVHVLDWTGDLYGVDVRVSFVERIRDERRFDGIDALVAQIRADAARAREILAR